VHGALLPLLVMPLGLALARLFAIDALTPHLMAIGAPFVVAVYYLAWKFLVGYLNSILGIG